MSLFSFVSNAYKNITASVPTLLSKIAIKDSTPVGYVIYHSLVITMIIVIVMLQMKYDSLQALKKNKLLADDLNDKEKNIVQNTDNLNSQDATDVSLGMICLILLSLSAFVSNVIFKITRRKSSSNTRNSNKHTLTSK